MSEYSNTSYKMYDVFSSMGSALSQYVYDQVELFSTPSGDELAPNHASQPEKKTIGGCSGKLAHKLNEGNPAKSLQHRSREHVVEDVVREASAKILKDSMSALGKATATSKLVNIENGRNPSKNKHHTYLNFGSNIHS